jgi:curved DNA-binding protein
MAKTSPLPQIGMKVFEYSDGGGHPGYGGGFEGDQSEFFESLFGRGRQRQGGRGGQTRQGMNFKGQIITQKF